MVKVSCVRCKNEKEREGRGDLSTRGSTPQITKVGLGESWWREIPINSQNISNIFPAGTATPHY